MVGLELELGLADLMIVFSDKNLISDQFKSY